jgi:uncharacterized membrane protein
MTMTMPPGWYAGPWNEAPLGWWDGEHWTTVGSAPPDESDRVDGVERSQPLEMAAWLRIWSHPVPRVAISLGLGIAAGGVARERGLMWFDYLLIGWGCTAAVFTALTWIIIVSFGPSETKQHAREVEPSRDIVRLLIVVGAFASLACVVRVLLAAPSDRHGPAAIAVVAVAISWFTIHTLYALTYAKRYYTGKEGGIDFNQTEPPRYTDFAYVACTIGMSFAVSDTNLKTSKMRRVALEHALLSYVFGTGIIASVVNLVVGL